MGAADPSWAGIVVWTASWLVLVGLAGWAFGLLPRRGE